MNCRHCTFSLAFALSALLTGCQHNARHVAAAPPPPPDITPQMVSVPPPSHPSEPLPAPPVVAIATPAAPVAEPPRKIRKPRKAVPNASAASTASAASPTPAPASPPTPAVQTAVATPPEVPGTLGQLSTGGESSGQALQQATELVHAQASRLNSLSTAQQTQYKTEVEQVKRFLTQADDALKSSDAEGARTLAVKAKVLLDEIRK